jgi:ribosomal protein L7Ae-like RNA K-turn-binding protein
MKNIGSEESEIVLSRIRKELAPLVAVKTEGARSIYLGLNAVCRQLEKEPLDLVVLCADIE